MNHDERGSENVSELKGNLRKFKLYLFFFCVLAGCRRRPVHSVIFHSENLMTFNNLHTVSLSLVSQDWRFSRARGSLMRGFPVRPYLTVSE